MSLHRVAANLSDEVYFSVSSASMDVSVEMAVNPLLGISEAGGFLLKLPDIQSARVNARGACWGGGGGGFSSLPQIFTELAPNLLLANFRLLIRYQ